MEQNKSNLFKIDFKDLARGVIVAVIGAGLTALYELVLSKDGLTQDSISDIINLSVGAGLSYLIKNYFSNLVRAGWVCEG